MHVFESFTKQVISEIVIIYIYTDLVVYLGDVITANNIPISNASLYWDQAIYPTKAKGIPWATVFGNHDDAPFSWPIDWFSSIGIPPRRCRDDVTSCSGEYINMQYIY